MLHAIVPVKSLDQAKSRLAPMLGALERRALTLAMLGDVLAALQAVPAIKRISVISRDPAVQANAIRHGVAALPDQASDLNGALTQAATSAVAHGAGALLVLPADLPLVTALDITTLLAAAQAGPGVVLAPSRDGGTNAMLLQPPLALPFMFGPGSLARHQEAARARAVAARIVLPLGMDLDVDQPADLLLLAKAGGTTATQRLVRAWRCGWRTACAL